MPPAKGVPMERQNNERLPLELSSQLVAIMTTEHYNLQTGRSMTIAEANGRSSLFVGAVSSGLVALAFVGQLSHLGTFRFQPGRAADALLYGPDHLRAGPAIGLSRCHLCTRHHSHSPPLSGVCSTDAALLHPLFA